MTHYARHAKHLPAHYLLENKCLTEAQLTFKLVNTGSQIDWLLNNDRLITVLVVDKIIERMVREEFL